MKILKIASIVFSIVLLTLLTQTGGIVLCISFLIHPVIDKRTSKCIYNYVLKVFVFIVLYLITVFIVVPPLARYFGRVPLPIQETKNLKPGNILTCILNRHYVKPELRNITLQAAAQLNHQYPGATVHYLDANFPFLDSFPLLPHRSHNDGKKLDLSFQYDNPQGKIMHTIPTFTGYGFCEAPKPGEYNMPEICEKKGYLQYNLLKKDSHINRLNYVSS